MNNLEECIYQLKFEFLLFMSPRRGQNNRKIRYSHLKDETFPLMLVELESYFACGGKVKTLGKPSEAILVHFINICKGRPTPDEI